VANCAPSSPEYSPRERNACHDRDARPNGRRITSEHRWAGTDGRHRYDACIRLERVPLIF
jgi:hypothetical protein